MERDQPVPQSGSEVTQFIEHNRNTIAHAFIYLSTETLENAQDGERRAFLSRFSIAVATINETSQWLNRATQTADEQRVAKTSSLPQTGGATSPKLMEDWRAALTALNLLWNAPASLP
jgi:hypothetical protein